jgi:(2Fe-2S) ferredoxin
VDRGYPLRVSMSPYPGRPEASPGVTACSLCAGETLGAADPFEGGQLARLQRLESRGVLRLTTAECLDECERGDVVVARPRPGCRGPEARPVWFERLAGDHLTERLADWLVAGGPGAAEVPAELVELRIRTL